MRTFYTICVLSLFINSIQSQVSFVSNGQKITSSNSWEIHLVDLNGDSIPDAYFENKVWANDGEGNFTKTSLGFGSSTFCCFSDLNGDGFVDALCNDSIFLNDGAFHISFSKKLVSDVIMYYPVLVDIDNDGDIDIISCSGNTDRILLNDGKGNFTNSGKSLGGWEQANYAFGDINGDGVTDIYVAMPHTPPPTMTHAANKIWFGDGKGNFTLRNHDITGAESRGAILADLDGDKDLDLFVSDRKTWGRLYLNDAAGNFTESSQKLGSHPVLSSTADFDKDGDTDLFICQNDGNSNGPPFTKSVPSIVMINDGTGNFTDSGLKLGNSSSMAVAVGDINNDGKTDIVVVNVKINSTTYAAEACPIEIWLNDSPTAIKHIMEANNNINYYPNPTTGQFSISFGSTPKLALVEIYNTEGKLLLKNTFRNTGNAVFNLNGYSKGIYLVKLSIDGKMYNKKICLE